MEFATNYYSVRTIILYTGSYEKRINDCNFLKELQRGERVPAACGDTSLGY